MIGSVIAPSQGEQHAPVSGDAAWSGTSISGLDAAFLDDGAQLIFGQRTVCYDSDAVLVSAFPTHPPVAIVDSTMVEGADDGFGGGNDAPVLRGVTTGDKTFEPVTIEAADPATGQPRYLFTEDDASANTDCLIPYSLIALILVGTVAIALLMTWVPSRQASRIRPATTLRYE